MSHRNELTLKLFNGVLASDKPAKKPVVNVTHGVVIDPYAVWAKDDIETFLDKSRLSGEELNKTFHKSWRKIKESSREELLVHQIVHYLTTYGTNFTAPVYIPDEVLEVPNVELELMPIQALGKEQLITKCLNILRSGVALAEETINDLLGLLDDLDYEFTGEEGITNKEAIVRIAEIYNVYPNDPIEFFRYLVYRATGETLLIKNEWLISLIKESKYNPSQEMKKYGLVRLAPVFNRFKPLFLAFKKKCPRTINKIAKLSKAHHEPMAQNPLNLATQVKLKKKDERWLQSATPYALFKALAACHARAEGQTSFVYRIRNGKAWANQKPDVNQNVCAANKDFIESFIKSEFGFEKGAKVYLPENVEYGLPTSEKMFVGNIPTGTRFYGKSLAVGIYWENAWGANDLDLSGVSEAYKVGWNADYSDAGGSLMYSGDMADASNGAVEYLHATNQLKSPVLVCNNVFSGSNDSGYKIIVGQGDDIDRNYMMNPNNLMLDVKTESVQRQMVLGVLMPAHGNKQSFTILNFGLGNISVSGTMGASGMALQALFEQWSNPLTLNHLLDIVGAEIVDDPDDADLDLSLDRLEKDTFTELFNSNRKKSVSVA